MCVSHATSPRLTAAERRRVIEQAATELFAQRGYAATTVDDIVQAAGVTKPMLYRHFESKQELCITLLERYRDELVAAPLARFDPEAGDAHAQLVAMTEAWLEHARNHPAATRLLFVPVTGEPEVERVQRELHARQRATQSALLREFAPALSDAEAEPMGEVTRSALAAMALWWIEHPDIPREVPVSVIVRMAEGLIGAGDKTNDRR
jgi:AcrR family transcriptional regulator